MMLPLRLIQSSGLERLGTAIAEGLVIGWLILGLGVVVLTAVVLEVVARTNFWTVTEVMS